MPQSGVHILEHVHGKFRAAFGEPYSMLGQDSQWTLRPHPDAPPIFVLINGSHEKPATWIFDPYKGIDNVWRIAIASEGDVDDSIAQINKRLAAAIVSWDGNGQRDGHRDGEVK